MSSLYSREGSSRYIRGDVDPKDINWEDLLSNDELLVLLKRNAKVKKTCLWATQEALKFRIELTQNGQILGTKFGRPYTFPTTLAWLEWIGFFEEVIKAICWARLFGESIMVFYEENDSEVDLTLPLSKPAQSCVAYHPMADGVGYEWDSFPQLMRIVIPQHNNTDTYLVNENRIVRFLAPKLDGKYDGNSEVGALTKLALIQEQAFRSIFRRLHLMGAGIITASVMNEDEKDAISSSLEGPLSYLNVIYTTGDLEQTMRLDVPDLKASQFTELWNISQEEIATASNFSKKLLSGDPQGAISSAQFDMELSYTEIYHIQQHYKRYIEWCLFYLGIDNTEFSYPAPRESAMTINEDVSS